MNLSQIHKDELIKLYSENSVNDLDNQPQLIRMIFGGIHGINTISDIESNVAGYKEFMIHLRTIKSNIEEIAKLPTKEWQVRYALIQLTNLVEGEEQVRVDIFNKIVEQLLIKRLWFDSPALAEKYNSISSMIQTWNHFFVSYTTRDTPPVNLLYKPELFNEFTEEIVKNEIKGNNLVAKYIVKCFKKYNNLKVFFDRDSIVCGDIIKDEVFEYCDKTFAFVQLIEDISFHSGKDETNWCFEEYSRFRRCDGESTKRMHFFLTADLTINPEKVPVSYKKWAEDIVHRKYERIFKPFDVSSIKKKCQEFSDRIKEERENYINNRIKSVA